MLFTFAICRNLLAESGNCEFKNAVAEVTKVGE